MSNARIKQKQSKNFNFDDSVNLQYLTLKCFVLF